MKIPLAKRLKKKLHIDTALLQDELMDIIYSLKQNAVLHGGTSIWRCYEGNRFSEDLDFYFSVSDEFRNKLAAKLKERDLLLKKYRKTWNVVFSRISDNQREVRLEINFTGQKLTPIIKAYEKTDGSYMDIFTLSVEHLLLEKIHAYKTRKLIRDVYDIHHLIKYAEVEQVKKPLADFLLNIEKPADELTLKTLVYSGAIPSFKHMVASLKTVL
jgi:predicted nucleotidyltransferase component of viral defense system